jgi:hypothetical protein
MANKLRQTSARVSFFAFQDMITTVTGVLIIVMLLLSMEVTQRAEASPDPARRAAAEQLREAQRQLTASLELLQQRQADASVLANRIFVLPQPDQSGKQPVLIVLSATNGWVTRLGQTRSAEFRPGHGTNGFEGALATCDPSKDRLVFYVRPSGIEYFNACHKAALQLGFAIGYDAAEEGRQYVLTR